MANFSDVTLSKSAFKLLQNKAHTSNLKDAFNEREATTLSLGTQDIFGDILPTDPSLAIAGNLAALVTLSLVLDPSSNGKAYLAIIPTVSGTGLDGKVNPRTGVAYTNGDRVGFLIPPKFDTAPPAPPAIASPLSYRAVLKNNGSEVFPADSSNWYLDYRTGIVVSENNLNLVSGTLEAYVYIGDLLSQKIAGGGGGGGGGYWILSGSDIKNTNAGDVLPDADLGASLGNATNRWSEAYLGPNSLHIKTVASESGGLVKDWKQYLTLPDGHFRIAEGASDYLTILNNGRVGIGTTSPSSLLTVFSGNLGFAESGGTSLRSIVWGNTTGPSPLAIVGNSVSGSEYLAFSTNTFGNAATERVRIDSAGNVGIGTTNPLGMLSIGLGSISDSNLSVQINAPLSGRSYYAANNNGSYGALFGYDSTFGGAVLRSAGAADKLSLVVNNTVSALTILSNGNVGLGTTNPGSILHIHKDIPSSGLGILVENTSNTANARAELLLKSNTTDGSLAVYEDSSADGGFLSLAAQDLGMHIRFDTESIERMRIESSGNVGIGTTNPTVLLDVRAASAQLRVMDSAVDLRMQPLAASNVGVLGTISSHDLALYSNNTERMRINISGNVGIGTVTPNSKLEIRDVISGTLGTSLYNGSTFTSNSPSAINNSFNSAVSLSDQYRGSARGIISSFTNQATNSTVDVYNYFSNYQSVGGGALTNRYGFYDFGLVLTSGTVANSYSFYAGSTTFATNTYGFYSAIASGLNRWNFYAEGFAPNYFAGNVGIGTSNPSSQFSVGSSSQFQVNSSGNLIKINDVSYSFPLTQGASNTVLTNNGLGVLTWAASGALTSLTTTTAISKEVVAYERCFVTAPAQVITLPPTPSVGIEVLVGVLNFSNTLVARNGSLIMGLPEDFTIDRPNTTVRFLYVSADLGWRII